MPRPIVRTLAILSKIAAIANGLLLGLFTLRRLIFIYGAKKGRWKTEHDFRPSSLLLVVPVHNEANGLPTFLNALTQLHYPAHQLKIVLVNDGSSDGSEAILKDWVAANANSYLLSLEHNVGKAQALNEALAAYGDSATSSSSGQVEFIAIYDADDRPQPDAIRHLLQPFADSTVAAVTGRRTVSNPLASPAASYATYENLVHQHITVAAKDAFNLAPPVLGSNCIYRTSALAQVGGFTPNALLEDSDLTIRFARAGWRTAYAPAAVSHHSVPVTLRGYVRQHLRWNRGFHEVALTPSPSPQPTLRERGQANHRGFPLPTSGEGCRQRRQGEGRYIPRLGMVARIELFLFSAGYLDRAALLLGLLQMHRYRLLRTPIVTYLLLPFFANNCRTKN